MRQTAGHVKPFFFFFFNSINLPSADFAHWALNAIKESLESASLLLI